jgi:hypothetical protein
MRQHDFEYEDVLRRALCAAADSIEPAGDGLERIRARLTTPRPLAAAWMMAGYTEVALPALIRLRSVLDGMLAWLRPAAGQSSVRTSAAGRPGSAGAVPGHSTLNSFAHRYRWLRPAAMAIAIVLAVAGGYGLTQLRTTLSTAGEVNLPLTGARANPQGGSPDGGGVNQVGGSSPGSVAPGTYRGHAQPSATQSCAPGALLPAPSSPKPDPSPSATSTPSPTPNPTATPSPTASATTSPAPSATAPAQTGTSAPTASPAALVYPVAPADPVVSPHSKKSSPPLSRAPCGSEHGPQAPGQRTVANPARRKAAVKHTV